MPYDWDDDELQKDVEQAINEALRKMLDCQCAGCQALREVKKSPPGVPPKGLLADLHSKGVTWGTCTTPPIKGSTFEEIAHKLIVETGGRTW